MRQVPALILLDESQQQALRAQQQETQKPRVPSRQHESLSSMGSSSASEEPRTNFRTHAHSGGRPTTGTNVSSPYTNLNSPRTDFTTRGQPNVNVNSNVLHYDLAVGKITTNSSAFATHRMSENDVDEYHQPPPEQNRYAGNSSSLRLSVSYTMVGVIVGLGLGILFSTIGVSSEFAGWFLLPGSLFLRALKCLVVPYVFCSVAVAIGDIVFVGKVSVVGLQTTKIFSIFWLTSTAWGMAVALFFRPYFRLSTTYESTTTNAVGFVCSNGMMLDRETNGSVACSSNATTAAGSHQFTIKDVNSVFEKNTDTVLADMTFSEQLIEILDSVVPSNIFSSMADSTLLSVITFAMVFGAIAGRMYFTKTRRVNYLYNSLLQLRNTFFLGMEWIIWMSPVAMVFLIGGQFASNQESVKKFDEVYLFVVANLVASTAQFAILLPLIVFLMTRCNPYTHMSHMTRAYMFAFACGSSLATAPVTLGCIQKGRVCSQSLSNFVISIGVVANLTALGSYCPIAMMFLAESSGNGDQITTLRIIVIYVLSLIACVGTPPIPNSGIVIMSTMYQTVFGVSDLPSTWALYVAMDFFVDRINTVCNVNDDIMALKIIAENTDETILGDHLGERY